MHGPAIRRCQTTRGRTIGVISWNADGGSAHVRGIPDRFDVMFDADKSIRPCRVVWHKEKQLGVEFG